MRLRQSLLEFNKNLRRKLIFRKVESLDVFEILESIDADQVLAAGKVQILNVSEVLESIETGQVHAAGKVEKFEVLEVLERIDAGQAYAAGKVGFWRLSFFKYRLAAARSLKR
jgi:hypothetical protein